ncbi:MAG: T9SS C-terminal target domain-containing protein [Acidobacteria bacterium]|jgi:hypothetical protein|nr:T9SS C-terminal target domain-containing protein [Acidobacteriota bacterium]
MKWNAKAVLPVLAMGALALAGCGGDSNDGGPTTPDQGQVVIKSGEITADETWTSNNEYLIQGALFVRSGATLTIQAGTTIFGDQATTGTLVIAQGGRLVAQGTATSPIVFTSSAAVGSRARGQWGGVILNGYAPLNVPGGQAQGEGGTGLYGGNDPSDSSGILRYVRVEFAGIEFSPDNELNGIAFQGTGAGTACDHLQVKDNLDDGFEFFGGTTSCKYMVSSANADDSFDWTDGWRGRGQFWIAQQRGDEADNGFECDNNAENRDAEPRSAPRIYNVTLIGDPDENEGTQSDVGMVLREGTAGEFRNFIVMGFKEYGVDVRDRSQELVNNGLSMANAITWQNKQGDYNGEGGKWRNDPTNVRVDPQLGAPYNTTNPDFMPAANGPARNGTVPVASPPSGDFFESANFIGGMGGTDWTEGWTDYSPN